MRAYILPKILGEKRALEVVLRRMTFTGEEAIREGLILWLYESDEKLQKEAYNIAQHIAELDELLLRNIKYMMKRGDNLYRQLLLEEKIQAEVLKAKSFQQGVSNFLNRNS